MRLLCHQRWSCQQPALIKCVFCLTLTHHLLFCLASVLFLQRLHMYRASPPHVLWFSHLFSPPSISCLCLLSLSVSFSSLPPLSLSFTLILFRIHLCPCPCSLIPEYCNEFHMMPYCKQGAVLYAIITSNMYIHICAQSFHCAAHSSPSPSLPLGRIPHPSSPPWAVSTMFYHFNEQGSVRFDRHLLLLYFANFQISTTFVHFLFLTGCLAHALPAFSCCPLFHSHVPFSCSTLVWHTYYLGLLAF